MEAVNNTNTRIRATLSASPADLTAKFAETVVAIKAYAKKHNYKLNGLDGETGLLALEAISANVFQNMSQNARKKTARRMRRFELHPTMSNANKLLAYLHKAALAIVPTFKSPKAELRYGATETAIRAARAAFVEARASFLATKRLYLEAKGEFYKNQTAK